MATETHKPQIETLNSPNTLGLNNDSSPKSDELNPNPNSTGDGNPNPSKTSSTPAVVVAAAAAAEDEVIQKKIKRAERFGVPVQMSEEEKRNSRSHRFGSGTGPEVSKSAEDQKRKARAERFGISVPADEEVKKKSRVERFGSNKKVDDVEEEKRKARALRFSNSQVTAVLHTNGNKDSASKAATVDNSSGAA